MSQTALCTVSEVTLSQWDELLNRFPTHTVFHTVPWLEAIKAVYGAKLILGRADVDGEPVAIWPVLAARKGPLRVMGSPLPGWSTAYMGPLFAEGADVQGAIDAFLGDRLFNGGVYFACKVINDNGTNVDLKPHGFEPVLNFETHCLDLTLSASELWDNLKSECRTRIRKARQLGLEIRQEPDDNFLEEYWAMSLETFSNTNIKPTFSKPFAGEMFRRLQARGRIRVLSAWQNGERIGMLVLPFDNHTMYYWGGASYLRVRGIPAHNLLHWTAIELAQELGLRRYDFISTLGGAGRFKRTFGPQTITAAIHWERTSSRLMKTLKEKYEQYLMMRQRLHGRSLFQNIRSMMPFLQNQQSWLYAWAGLQMWRLLRHRDPEAGLFGHLGEMLAMC